MSDAAIDPWAAPDDDEEKRKADYQASLETARATGYSWGDIFGHIAQGTIAAADAGYTQREIDDHLGFADPAGFEHNAKATWATHIADGMKTTPPVESDYAAALLAGEVKGPQDFAERYMAQAVGAAHDIHGADDAEGDAHLAAASADAAEMAQTLPTRQDLADAAVALDPSDPATARKNLLDHWQDTGQRPVDAAIQARKDPGLMAQLLTPSSWAGTPLPDAPEGFWDEDSATARISATVGAKLGEALTGVGNALIDNFTSEMERQYAHANELAGKSLKEQALDPTDLEHAIAAALPSPLINKMTSLFDVARYASAFNKVDITAPIGEALTGISRDAMIADAAKQGPVHSEAARIATLPEAERLEALKPPEAPVGTEVSATEKEAHAAALEDHAQVEELVPAYDAAKNYYELARDLGSSIWRDEAGGVLIPFRTTADQAVQDAYAASRDDAQRLIIQAQGKRQDYMAPVAKSFDEFRKLVTPMVDKFEKLATGVDRANSEIGQFYASVENRNYGGAMEGKLAPLADAIRNVNDAIYQKFVEAFDAGKMDLVSYRDNYYRHLWQDPRGDAWEAMWKPGTGRQGATAIGSTKERSLPTMTDGLLADLKPRFANPIDNTIYDIGTKTHYLAALDVLDQAKTMNHAYYATERTKLAPGDMRLNGIAERGAGAETSAKGASFTTAKGSTYEVNADGTTTRNKSFHPEHGAADQGLQPRSEQTFYVSAVDAQKLGEIQSQGGGARIIAPLGDGRWGVKYTEGKDAGKFERRTVVTAQTAPGVGLTPVETFKGGARVHFGNEITEVRAATPAVKAEGGFLYGTEGFARSYNNWLDAGLLGHPSTASAYQKLLWMTNTMTGMKLALPTFHMSVVGLGAWSSTVAGAFEDLMRGNFGASAWKLAKAATAVGPAVADTITGMKLMKAYAEGAGSPILSYMSEAGLRIGPRQAVYRYGPRSFQQAAAAAGSPVFSSGGMKAIWKDVWSDVKAIRDPNVEKSVMGMVGAAGRTLALPVNELGRIMNTITDPVFDHAVPALKVAAGFRRMQSWIKANDGAEPLAVWSKAREIVKDLDNRYGELNQDTLFWRQGAKQAANLAMVSTGWVFGSYRGFAAAVGLDIERGKWAWNQNPTVAASTVGTAVGYMYANAVAQYFHTGLAPWQTDTPWQDMLNYRTGASGKTGTPERGMLPSEIKELYDLSKIVFTAVGTGHFADVGPAFSAYMTAKENPFWQTINGLRTGKDSLDHRIAYTPTGITGFIASQFSPIVVDQLRHNRVGTGISLFEKVMGWREAAGYVEDPAGFQTSMGKLADRWTKEELQRAGREAIANGEEPPEGYTAPGGGGKGAGGRAGSRTHAQRVQQFLNETDAERVMQAGSGRQATTGAGTGFNGPRGYSPNGTMASRSTQGYSRGAQGPSAAPQGLVTPPAQETVGMGLGPGGETTLRGNAPAPARGRGGRGRSGARGRRR